MAERLTYARLAEIRTWLHVPTLTKLRGIDCVRELLAHIDALEAYCRQERDDSLRIYAAYIREDDAYNANYWKGRADALRGVLKEGDQHVAI